MRFPVRFRVDAIFSLCEGVFFCLFFVCLFVFVCLLFFLLLFFVCFLFCLSFCCCFFLLLFFLLFQGSSLKRQKAKEYTYYLTICHL